MSTCQLRAAIDRHFAGTISQPDERAMRVHLASCDGCRAYYRRHRILSRLDPTALSAEDRIGRALGLVPPPTPRRSLRSLRASGVMAATVLAFAAALLLIIRWSPLTSGSEAGFTARGSSVPSTMTPRVHVYRIQDGGAPTRARETLSRGDELAFSYESSTSLARLVVFGIDDRHRVYWFHPAWVRADEEPSSIAIEADGRRHDLPEAIRHSFDGARLEIHALFTERALTVREVEAMIEPSGEVRPPPGAIHHTSTFELDDR